MIEILDVAIAGVMTDRSGRSLAIVSLRICHGESIERLIAFCQAEQLGHILAECSNVREVNRE